MTSWKRCLAVVLGLGAAVACKPSAVPVSASRPAALEVTVRPDRERQTIHSFGASDAWSIQFVGKNWPEAKRNRIADLLFSLDRRPDGSPVGIGLSAWRFNIGAGSAEQGAASGIPLAWRRAESFLRADGSYDWSKQAGERWFLRAAQARGVPHFIGFVNSPPVHFTRNGKALSSGGEASNLAPDRYDDFARFLRDVVVQLERQDGVRLDYVSPVNEPQWDWMDKQEGSPWLNTEVRAAVAELSAAFHGAGLQTGIDIPEAAKLNYLYEDADRPRRGSQAAAFFDKASPLYAGDMPNVPRKVAGHSYFTTHPVGSMLAVRSRLRDRLRAIDPGLELWMSEYCVLENNPEIRGGKRDLGMNAALYVARVIHADLTVAEATAWHWWLAVSPFDYKDGLVYIDDNPNDGAIYESKLLWALGHFSRFVRPGMRRIDVERSDGLSPERSLDGVLVSAYRHPATSETVVVLVNQQAAEARLRVRAPGTSTYRAYRTSAEPGEDLKLVGEQRASRDVVLPPRSLVTLVSK